MRTPIHGVLSSLCVVIHRGTELSSYDGSVAPGTHTLSVQGVFGCGLEAMRIHWNRIGRLAVPLGIAFAIAAFLQEFFDFSRLSAMPCGLWVAVRINNRFIAPRYNAQYGQTGMAAAAG